MKRTIPAALFGLLLLLPANARALTVLKGADAVQHLGDAKTHFMGKNYTFEMLKRSHRDAMHGRFSDAVIFNAGGGLFGYLRRKDGDHRFVIDDPAGREEEPVTEDAWRRDIQNALSDDNPEPVVFLDDQGNELATVFIGRGTKIDGKLNDAGLLEVGLEVEGGKDNRSRRRMMM